MKKLLARSLIAMTFAAAALQTHAQKAPSQKNVRSLSKPAATTPYDVLFTARTSYCRGLLQNASPNTIIITPLQIDIGMALGLKADDLLKILLDKHSAQLPADVRSDIHTYMMPQPRAIAFYDVAAQSKNPAVILAQPFFTGSGENTLPAFDCYSDAIAYVNLHETWHTRAGGLRDIDTPQIKTPALLTGNPPFWLESHDTRLTVYRNLYTETFADLGAAGDMIDAGHTTRAIDIIAAWRDKYPRYEQRSPRALQSLREYIEHIGIEKFRSLDTQARTTLYDRITRDNIPTATGLYIAAFYDAIKNEKTYTGKNTIRAANSLDSLKQAAHNDSQTAIAMAFIDSYTRAELAQAQNPRKAPATHHPEAADRKALYDAAFRIFGEVSKKTVIMAYAQMMDSLQQQAAAAPYTPALDQQATKLRQTFITSLNGIDLVAENNIRLHNRQRTQKR